MNLSSSLLCFALLTSCQPPTPITAPVVAGAGEAARAVPAAIDSERAAAGERLSRVAASAEAITAINSGQPASARTDGVAAEAGLILRTAGQPSDVDRLAALDRARLVAEGRATDIAAAYAHASTDAALARTRAEAAEKALTSALAAAAVEQEAQRARLQQELDRIAAEANARVEAATRRAHEEARAWQRKLITIITFGFGVLLIAGGFVVQFTAASIPMFGPKAGIILIGAGGLLVVLGILITQIQNFLDDHPWVTGAFLIVCSLAVVASVALMYANHKHRQPEAA
jgi:uncharacterized membrane protein YidH (DUF202 family)